MPRESLRYLSVKPEFEIQLRDVALYAYHGILPEERRLGNQYRVNVRLKVDAQAFDPDADDLSSTVSYADVFEIVKEKMSVPSNLLESVAIRIADSVKSRWPLVKCGEVEIVKIVPPVSGMIGEAGVKYIF